MIKQELIGRIDPKLKGDAYKREMEKVLSPESIANYKPQTQKLKKK